MRILSIIVVFILLSSVFFIGCTEQKTTQQDSETVENNENYNETEFDESDPCGNDIGNGKNLIRVVTILAMAMKLSLGRLRQMSGILIILSVH